MSDDSYVSVNAKGQTTSFVGSDAVALASAITLRSALTLYKKHKMIPTRGMTITRMLTIATSYTKKPYKRGAYDAALADLTEWIGAMKAAMPIVHDADR